MIGFCRLILVLGWVIQAGFGYSQGTASPSENLSTPEVLFQYSTLSALNLGLYEGEMTFAELKQHGEFGIGTVNGLDGELIGIEGQYYHIRTDGVAYPVEDSEKTPFANVTFFEPDWSFSLQQPLTFEPLKAFIDTQIPSRNLYYAIQITGTFSYVKTRSVPKQTQPYPPLPEVVKIQTTFEFENVEGTMIGYRFPDFMQGLNNPGYHFHFITKDRKSGGHVLEVTLGNVTLQMDFTPGFSILLPNRPEFYNAQLPNTNSSAENPEKPGEPTAVNDYGQHVSL